MQIRNIFKRGGSMTDSSEKGYAAPQSGPQTSEAPQQHKDEQDKRERFDLEEQMKRWAAEDDKDVKRPR